MVSAFYEPGTDSRALLPRVVDSRIRDMEEKPRSIGRR